MSTLITDKVDKAAVHNEKLDTSAYLPHTPWLQFLLVCCLFALWGMAGNLNDILIAQFKKGFDLTDTQTALVQSIFFLAKKLFNACVYFPHDGHSITNLDISVTSEK